MFHQFHYVGDDLEADMIKVEKDPVVRFWWSYCEPCQESYLWQGPPPSQGGTGASGEDKGIWWAPLIQMNHCGGWATDWAPHGNYYFR